MKSFYPISLFSLCCVLLCACASTVPVYKVGEANCPSEKKGIFYALPKTEVITDITVSQTREIPGLYRDCSYLIGMESKDMSDDTVTKYKIEDIKLSSIAVVDAQQWYYVDVEPAKLKKIGVTIEQTESGIISSGTSEAEDQSVAIATEIIELSASIASKFIPFSGTTKTILSVNMTAEQMLTIPSEKCEKAKIVAQQIFDLRKKRLELISNKTMNPLSAEAFQAMLKEIDAMEKDLLALFVGTKKTKTATIRFKTDNISDQALFTFSSKSGLSALSNQVGQVPNDFLHGTGGDVVRLLFQPGQALPPSMTAATTNSKSGFYYRIPVNTVIKVSRAGVVLQEGEMLIAQKGLVMNLPAKIGSIKSKCDLKFDPKTGALVKTVFNGESVSAESLSKLSDAGQKVLDVIKPDELSELEKQRKILEEKKKIKELTTELGSQN